MPTGAQNESKQPRKRSASLKARENAGNSKKPVTKRVKKSKTPEQAPPDVQPSSTPEPTSDAESDQSVDVSDHIYTLSTCCMLDKDQIFQDSDYCKIHEWSYRLFNVKCVKKIEKVCESGKYNTEWVSGNAVISARGVAKARALTIAVDDETSWRKVERFVEDWMKQGRKDIIVKLTTHWEKRKANSDAPELDEELVDKPKHMVFNQLIQIVQLIIHRLQR
jgi:hypothetical protein